MTPEEYRAAIKRLGLSQVAAGKLLGVDGRTSQKWALGERAVPPPVALLLAYIERYGVDLAKEMGR
jgi:transcriptional regulator with XRE-family HTH domain